jgi:hypothetical protein
MPFFTEVRASPESRPKPMNLKGAEEHADFVLSRNLARENPLSRPHAPPEKSNHNPPNRRWSMRLHFHQWPPATDLISKPHAPDHKPHPNDPGDRRNKSSTLEYRRKDMALCIYKSVDGLSGCYWRDWLESCYKTGGYPNISTGHSPLNGPVLRNRWALANFRDHWLAAMLAIWSSSSIFLSTR